MKIIKIIQFLLRTIYELAIGFLCSCGITLLIFLHEQQKAISLQETTDYYIYSLYSAFFVLYVVFSIFRYIRNRNMEKVLEEPLIDVEKLKEKIFNSTYEQYEELQQISATHEAGHVIMCHLNNKRVRSVTINNMGGGNTEWVYMNPLCANEEELRSWILICYAGAAAEEVLLGRISYGSMGGKHYDYEYATDYIRRYYIFTDPAAPKIVSDAICTEQMILLGEQLYQECKELIIQNKDMVTAIQKELLQKGELAEKELESILSTITCTCDTCE